MPVHLLTALSKRTKREMHISEVPSGLDCECICPWCHEELIAKHGSKEPDKYVKTFSDHFAHHNTSECFNSQLHSLAEEIIVESRYINLPGLSWTHYLEAIREYQVQDYRVDNFIFTEPFGLAIEIIVQNPVPRKKVRWYKNQPEFYSLAITLDPEDFPEKLNSRFARKKIKKKVLVSSENKMWIRKPEDIINDKPQKDIMSRLSTLLHRISINMAKTAL